MLAHRLIPSIILKGEMIVQSFGFKRYLPIGRVRTAIEFFNNWDVDEIVLLDIEATKQGRKTRLDIIEWAAKECFVPLTIGGGIREIDDIRQIIRAGADKVCVNSFALENPSFITAGADRFGTQCITVSIDAKRNEQGAYEVFGRGGSQATGRRPDEWARQCEKLGAGEILLNSIERDGSRKGYDIELLKSVSDSVAIPVIACGGVGRVEHFVEGISAGGCQAVAAANIFQHTEHSTIAAKAALRRAGINVRLSSAVKYEGFSSDHMGRPL